MSNIVTVFTKPECPQCNHTKNFLNSKKVTFEEDTLEDNAYAEELIERFNIQSAPLTIVRDTETGEIVYRTSGFRVNELVTLVNKHVDSKTDDEVWDF